MKPRQERSGSGEAFLFFGISHPPSGFSTHLVNTHSRGVMLAPEYTKKLIPIQS